MRTTYLDRRVNCLADSALLIGDRLLDHHQVLEWDCISKDFIRVWKECLERREQGFSRQVGRLLQALPRITRHAEGQFLEILNETKDLMLSIKVKIDELESRKK